MTVSKSLQCPPSLAKPLYWCKSLCKQLIGSARPVGLYHDMHGMVQSVRFNSYGKGQPTFCGVVIANGISETLWKMSACPWFMHERMDSLNN